MVSIPAVAKFGCSLKKTAVKVRSYLRRRRLAFTLGDNSLKPKLLHNAYQVRCLSFISVKRIGAALAGQEFVIGRYTPGNPFDALIVGYYESDKLLYVAKVRNGFVPQVRREVASRFKGLVIDTCPFANLPERKRTLWALTKEEMKNCVWLKPELVAQIEFTEWTPDGHLRHSKFVGLREDKTAREVGREV